MSFAHITLATRDTHATADFFERTLLWRRVKVPGNAPAELDVQWVEVSPDGTPDRKRSQQVHILRVADFEPSRFEAEFGRHFAVFHPQADFSALRKRLVEHGATLIDPIRPTPFERLFFRDPNGYGGEVIAEEQYVRE
jgi:catechol 2,3-dioxygenase-like lactoylglutathione lyase family enzyme